MRFTKKNMLQRYWLLLLTVSSWMLVLTVQARIISFEEKNGVKYAVYISPQFVLTPGSVVNKFYQNVDFPKGHVSVKEFNAELVDRAGNPVPLHETYLHHWVMQRYYVFIAGKGILKKELRVIPARNSGTCQDNALGQYFGLGAETRQTDAHIPEPYGIEFGNPTDIPAGYEEQWELNVHAIDTRGVVDRMGCTECRCALYNMTVDRPNYVGGLSCCINGGQCRVRKGFKSIKRKLYLRYTVKWIDWVDTVLPVKVYILDVTDTTQSRCTVEYDVQACGGSVPRSKCVHSRKANIVMPKGGLVIYGVSHQHAGAIGSSLYGADGRLLCSSNAKYGQGKEAGNEAGYVVGMTTCYPTPGSVKIYDGEALTLETNYNSSKTHIGLMGLFYLLVADHPADATLPNVQGNASSTHGH